MKIRKLRLLGFKSFAEETEILFSESVTCFVGPNGCGKSNIFDAMRWVFGQKTAHSLRGKAMDDFIFFGSSGKTKSNLAQVELEIDNRERRLASLDSDDVRITRRHYLGRGSEYYINDQQVSHRDLQELFYNTGLNQLVYAFIGQGKIAEILTASPEMRRKLIDEVAEVSTPKAKKTESMQHLIETEQNLKEITLILQRKSAQVEGLKQEARKARQYNKLSNQAEQLDLIIRKFTWQQLSKDFTSLQKQSSKNFENSKSIKEQQEKQANKIQMLKDNCQKLYEKKRTLKYRNEFDVELVDDYHKSQQHYINMRERCNIKVTTLNKQIKSEQQKQFKLKKRSEQLQQMQLSLLTKLGDSSHLLDEKMKQRETIKSRLLEIQKREQHLDTILKDRDEKLQKIQYFCKQLAESRELLYQEIEKKSVSWQDTKQSALDRLQKFDDWIATLQTYLQENNLQALKQCLNNEMSNEVKKMTKDFIDSMDILLESLLGENGYILQGASLHREKNIKKTDVEDKKIKQELANCKLEKEKLQSNLIQIQQAMVRLELEQKNNEVAQKSQQENSFDSEDELLRSQKHLQYFQNELKQVEMDLKNNEESWRQRQNKVSVAKKRAGNYLLEAQKIEKNIQSFAIKIKEEETLQKEQNQDNMQLLLNQERMKADIENIEARLRGIESDLFNDYEKKMEEVEVKIEEVYNSNEASIDQLKQKMVKVKRELKLQGFVNLRAEEELEQASDALKKIREQKHDIEQARANIIKFIDELDEVARKLFMKTIRIIEEKFHAIVEKLFGGGRAQLEILDRDNLLETGIDIRIQPLGKKNSTISILSGGEQTLGALAFLFALYHIKPLPICFLDEADANLDDSNVPRLLDLVKNYANSTQFFIITHNKLTMTVADLIIGITQETAGISRVVGLQTESVVQQ